MQLSFFYIIVLSLVVTLLSSGFAGLIGICNFFPMAFIFPPFLLVVVYMLFVFTLIPNFIGIVVLMLLKRHKDFDIRSWAVLPIYVLALLYGTYVFCGGQIVMAFSNYGLSFSAIWKYYLFLLPTTIFSSLFTFWLVHRSYSWLQDKFWEQKLLLNILDIVFRLPPKEKRRKLYGTIWQKYLLPRGAPPDREDVYVMYLAAKYSYILCGVLLFAFGYVYWARESLDLFIWEIIYDPTLERLTESLVIQFANAMRFIILCLLLPFFLVKLRWNFNPSVHEFAFDYDQRKLPPNRFSKTQLIALYGLFAVLLLVGFYGGDKGFSMPGIKSLYSEDYISFLIFSALMIVGFPLFLPCILMIFIGSYKRFFGIIPDDLCSGTRRSDNPKGDNNDNKT